MSSYIKASEKIIKKLGLTKKDLARETTPAAQILTEGGGGSGGGTDRTVSKHIESPAVGDAVGLFKTPVEITVKQLNAFVYNSSDSVTWTIRYATNRGITSGTEVVTGGTVTAGSVAAGSNITSFDNAIIPADSWIWIYITAQSGDTIFFDFTMVYDVN